MARRGIEMSLIDVERHQIRHGFAPITALNREPEITTPVIPKPRMNKTESSFALILEAHKRRGDIVDYKFEGLTIRLADQCRYTPDFFILVSVAPLVIRFAEIKGAHIWDDSKVKFRVAREQNPWAQWEMHQKKGGAWSRIA